MSSEEFSIGAIVKLKSGGPSMTVYGFIMNDKVPCKWYDESLKDFKTKNFELQTLTIIKPNP